MLQVALAVAQAPEGACMLLERGVFGTMAAMARHLLGAQGGALATFNVVRITGEVSAARCTHGDGIYCCQLCWPLSLPPSLSPFCWG